MPLASAANVFLTGATGFLGKVTLAEILRQRRVLGVGRIYVLVRGKRGKSARERFDAMLASPCFKQLPPGWTQGVQMVEGALEQPQCGISDVDFAPLAATVTHVVHCAASVEFDLPPHQAAEANVVSSLNVLAMSRSCSRLRRMVSVSTAYVTPHHAGPIREMPAPLPAPASTLFDAIMAKTFSKEELLAATGHPNTYTLTKSIAEHLLMQRRGDVPLRIVRPSIISAAWQHPHPGWIDSNAALAGFIMSIGAGYMRVINGEWTTQLDVVPVDIVAERIIEQAFIAPDVAGNGSAVAANDSDVPIAYAVSGVPQASTIRGWVRAIERCFARHPVGRRAVIHYLGPDSWRYQMHRWLHHAAPAKAAELAFRARKMRTQERQVRRGAERLESINRVFPYFTSRTFDFRAGRALPESFDLQQYLAATCEGVLRNLMGQDPTAVRLAGKKAHAPKSDLLWAMGKPAGNWAIRLSAAGLSKVMRQVFDEVTVDQASFERAVQRARELAGKDCKMVVLPAHRSYMDFLVCSYLFFARPSLNISVPHIAAAQEFSRIPAVGWLFKQMHAFYIKRGNKQADPELNAYVHELLDKNHTLEFFIEGQRSRSRHFLLPRRGLLRCLQSTGGTFVALPVALSYDRVPEESAFLRELKGYPKNKMKLRGLLRWASSMARGEVSLGRLHVSCGEPLLLDGNSDIPSFSVDVLQELQSRTAISDFHLHVFAAAHPDAGISAEWLREAILQRGGTVLESRLRLPAGSASAPHVIDPALERSLRNQWEHLFFADARAWQPNNAAIADYTQQFGFTRAVPPAAGKDPTRDALLRLLFAPVCADYQAVVMTLKRFAGKKQKVATDHVLRRTSYNDYTTTVAAMRALVKRGLLTVVDSRHHAVVGAPAAFTALLARSTLATPRRMDTPAPGATTLSPVGADTGS